MLKRIFPAITLLTLVCCNRETPSARTEAGLLPTIEPKTARNLTPESARPLIEAYFRGEPQWHDASLTTSYSSIVPLLNNTTVNNYNNEAYRHQVDVNAPSALISRLLAANLIAQETHVVNHVDLTGHYEGDNAGQPVFADLTMTSGSLKVRGRYRAPMRWEERTGTIEGLIEENGVRAKLSFPGLFSHPVLLNIETGDDFVRLTEDASRPLILTFREAGGLKVLPVTFYSYVLTPAFEQNVVNDERHLVRVGKLRVQAVRRLLLGPLGDTLAGADLEWAADLNTIGQALNGKATVEGNGNVEFGKQPDGNWVVTNIRINESS